MALRDHVAAVPEPAGLGRAASPAGRRRGARGRAPSDTGGGLEHDEVETALRQAIAALPEERRIVVVLRDVEGLSYDEIATALNLEPGTVRSRLHRARLDLKAKLERFLP